MEPEGSKEYSFKALRFVRREAQEHIMLEMITLNITIWIINTTVEKRSDNLV